MDLFKKALSRASLKRYAKAFVRNNGADLDGHLPESVALELRLLANAVEDQAWTGATLAEFVSLLQKLAGRESAAAVQAVVRRIEADTTLMPGPITDMLLDEAKRIERETS